ncbi:MAG: ABC transporter, permease protein 1 (cluster 1, maltose/g3p/polyamine/iron), partial [uncultured Rubrobacteraceae bacterium]
DGRAQEGGAIRVVHRGPLPVRGPLLPALRRVHPLPDRVLRGPKLRAVQRGEHLVCGARELQEAALRRALSQVALEHGAHTGDTGSLNDRAGDGYRLRHRLGPARKEAQGGLPARLLLAGGDRPRDVLGGLLLDLLGALRRRQSGARPDRAGRHPVAVRPVLGAGADNPRGDVAVDGVQRGDSALRAAEHPEGPLRRRERGRSRERHPVLADNRPALAARDPVLHGPRHHRNPPALHRTLHPHRRRPEQRDAHELLLHLRHGLRPLRLRPCRGGDLRPLRHSGGDVLRPDKARPVGRGV